MNLKPLGRAWRTATRGVRKAVTWPEKELYASGALDPSNLTLPDYFCIGAQKAGTTWLFRNCRLHPDIFVAREKEVHYFDQNFHWSLRTYAGRFIEGRGRIKGEFTPAYGVLPESRIRFIRRVMPRLRVILLMRHPIERAWSQALMEIVYRYKRPYESVEAAEFLDHFRSDWALSRGDYATILEKWSRYFPEEQILTGFQEEMAADPRGLMERVCRHLGASTEIDWGSLELDHVRGKGLGIPLPDRFREVLWELYREPLQRLHQRLGDPVTPWLDPAYATPDLGPRLEFSRGVVVSRDNP